VSGGSVVVVVVVVVVEAVLEVVVDVDVLVDGDASSDSPSLVVVESSTASEVESDSGVSSPDSSSEPVPQLDARTSIATMTDR